MLLILLKAVRREEGQDIVEYTLVLAVLAIIAAAVYVGVGGSVDALWRVMNSRMTNAGS